MASIIVRNIDKTVVQRIDELAAKKGMSRETYIRGILKRHALAGEVKEVENKYNVLVEKITVQLNVLTETIEKNNYYVELMMDQGNKEDS